MRVSSFTKVHYVWKEGLLHGLSQECIMCCVVSHVHVPDKTQTKLDD